MKIKVVGRLFSDLPDTKNLRPVVIGNAVTLVNAILRGCFWSSRTVKVCFWAAFRF